jgi:hypothetical protein
MQRSLLVTGTVVVALQVGVGMTSSCTPRDRATNHWAEASPQLTELIRKQEIGVWEALKNKDKVADRNLLTEDFIGVYKDGFGNRAEHIAQIDDKYQLTEYKLENVRVLMIAADSAMIVYRATCRAAGTWANDCAQPMYISSLWISQDSKWVNVFSQDTSAAKKDPK